MTMLFRIIVAVIGTSLSMTALADAHAEYVGSTSTAGALRIQFSEGVEAAFSHVHVTDANGHAVTTGPLTTASADRSLVIVPIGAALRPGQYHVTWDVSAIDTHRTQGAYTFTVGGRVSRR